MYKRNQVETKCKCGARIGKGWEVWFQDGLPLCDNCEMRIRAAQDNTFCDTVTERTLRAIQDILSLNGKFTGRGSGTK